MLLPLRSSNQNLERIRGTNKGDTPAHLSERIRGTNKGDTPAYLSEAGVSPLFRPDCFRGRHGSRRVDSSPSFFAIRLTHLSSPNGLPRRMLNLSRSSVASPSDRFTR